MADFTAAASSIPTSGKHNMASEAFDALRARRGTEAPKLTFSDVLDTLNPLQHIPVVSQIYRHLTGDTISPAARVAGDTLYGGPVGLVAAVADSAIAAVSGKDVGEHVFASLFGDDKPTTVAGAATPDAATTAKPADTTGSIAAASPSPKRMVAQTEPKQANRTKPVPQLSPEAFNALLGSFSNPDAAKSANPSLAAAAAETAVAPATPAAKFSRALPAKSTPPLPTDQAVALAAGGGATKPSKDLMSAMQTALDQYDAMKATNPALPAASLNMSGDASGF